MVISHELQTYGDCNIISEGSNIYIIDKSLYQSTNDKVVNGLTRCYITICIQYIITQFKTIHWQSYILLYVYILFVQLLEVVFKPMFLK